MTTDSTASMRHEASHANRTTRTATIIAALKRRAQSVLSHTSIDAQDRAIIRYAMETHDPWLAELVRRAEAEEPIGDTLDFSQTADADEHDASIEKVEALTDMLCGAGIEPEKKAAAVLVLMAAIENSMHPKALANAAKHLAFNRCGELNLCGMLEAQIAIIENELLALV